MFAIDLESDSIYLHGSSEESAGTQVRGCVQLSFKETTRVKSISLQFTGLLKMNWQEDFAKATFPSPQRRQQCKLKKTVFQHDWALLPIRNLPHTMKSNTVYRFPFDLALPGDMAESITSPAGGSLVYEFKATVVRPFATKNLTLHRPLQVVRQLPLDVFYGSDGLSENNRMMTISKTYSDKVDYRIQLDNSVYQRGQPINIHFAFKPLIQGLRVEHVSCFLKEYITLASPMDDNSSNSVGDSSQPTVQQLNQQSRIVSLSRDDRFPCHGADWRHTETLIIPRSARAIHNDSTHPLIHIEHKLRLTICFVQDNGHLSELRVTMPIRLLETPTTAPAPNGHLTMDDPSTSTTTTTTMGDDLLPRYEDACLITPYDPQLQFWSSPSSSPMVSPSPSLPSLIYHSDSPSPSYEDSTTDHQPSPPHMIGSYPPLSCDYFSYQPSQLQRVPSYETAIRTPF
ncbi:hypothetical protein [Absidia glauca]|uniref:Arrestin C-terminal-like domain-containing protein n=1 Tax=Absidia glauca TaxID=4829 RepID=A0A163IST9_ABSGL|nr:hypothetical protein [Absidia glauca]